MWSVRYVGSDDVGPCIVSKDIHPQKHRSFELIGPFSGCGPVMVILWYGRWSARLQNWVGRVEPSTSTTASKWEVNWWCWQCWFEHFCNLWTYTVQPSRALFLGCKSQSMSEWSLEKDAKANSLVITPCATHFRDEDSFCLFQWGQLSGDFSR